MREKQLHLLLEALFENTLVSTVKDLAAAFKDGAAEKSGDGKGRRHSHDHADEQPGPNKTVS